MTVNLSFTEEIHQAMLHLVDAFKLAMKAAEKPDTVSGGPAKVDHA
jgi:hypothetical protein